MMLFQSFLLVLLAPILTLAIPLESESSWELSTSNSSMEDRFVEVILIGLGMTDANVSNSFEFFVPYEDESNLHLPIPPSLPNGTIWPMAANLFGRPMVCGGTNDNFEPLEQCFTYWMEKNVWEKEHSLLLARSGAAAVTLSDGSVWISGGRGPSGYVQATEIADETGHLPGPPLLHELGYHRAVSLDNNRVFIGFGEDRTEKPYFSTKSYVQDFGKEWIILGDAKSQRLPTCGTFDWDQNKAIIATGGRDDVSPIGQTQLLLSSGENGQLEWVDGPELPRNAFGAAGVTINGQFFLLGGKSGDNFHTFSSEVHRFDPVQGWTVLNKRLKNYRAHGAAFALRLKL